MFRYFERIFRYFEYIRVRGVPARDISSLRVFGPGGGAILCVARMARACFGVWDEKCCFYA